MYVGVGQRREERVGRGRVEEREGQSGGGECMREKGMYV